MSMFFTLLLLVVMQTAAFSQSDFSPGSPPSVQPFVPGPVPPGNPHYTSGVIASQELGGVQRGSTVYFDVVLDWWGLTPLSLSPMSDKGNDFRYIDDPSDPWRRWEQPGLGYFCFRCSWSFRVTEDNPTLVIEYIGDSRFGAHLEVWYVEPPPPEPVVVRVDPAVTQQMKNRAWNIATVGFVVSSVAITGAGVSCSASLYGLCFMFGLIGFSSAWTTAHYERIANDPYDPEYQSAYATGIDPVEEQIAWGQCAQVAQYDESGGHLTALCNDMAYISLTAHAYLKAAWVSIDRMESCVINNDPCQYWQRDLALDHLHNAAYWAWWLGYYYHHGVGVYLDWIGFNTYDDVAGHMHLFGEHLMWQYDDFASAY